MANQLASTIPIPPAAPVPPSPSHQHPPPATTINTPATANVVRNLAFSFPTTSNTVQNQIRVQQIGLQRSSTPKRMLQQVTTTNAINTATATVNLSNTTNSTTVTRPNKKQKVETLTWAAPFQIMLDPQRPEETYRQLQEAMTYQNNEAKLRYKNLLLPNLSTYPKLSTDGFLKWKKHFESVCYTTVELSGLLEDGPLVNPTDKPNQQEILYQGQNGTTLFYLAQSTYQHVDLYCNKINHHLWQALLEAIKDDITALSFVTSVPALDYSALWSKLCNRWLETSEIRKSKVLHEFNNLQRKSKETFKEFYHRLEIYCNNLLVEFDYEVPEDQISLKVLYGVQRDSSSDFIPPTSKYNLRH
jgi:hypothetical protein